jgi:hypothetical protein
MSMGRAFGVRDQFRALGLNPQVEAGPGHSGEGCWHVRPSDVSFCIGSKDAIMLLVLIHYALTVEEEITSWRC